MISINTTKSTTTIKAGERFDSSVSQEFAKNFKDYPNTNQFIIDLSETKYIDSAALGALIALHHYAGTTGGKIKLIGIGESVDTIFKMANFDQLFDITK